MFIQKVFLINANHQILIIKRKDVNMYKGFWDIPGGRIEESETLKQALQREIKEETNLQFNRLILILTSSKFIGKALEKPIIFRNFYLCSASGAVKLSSEHSDMKWIDREELEKIEFPDDPDFQAAQAKLLEVLPEIKQDSCYSEII